MSNEGKFEETRIKNPDEAHEEANILSFARSTLEHRPTAEEYEEALGWLNALQEDISQGSELDDKTIKLLRGRLEEWKDEANKYALEQAEQK